MLRRLLPAVLGFALPLALAACGSNTTPGAMSGSEAQQLNDAAMMLDANSMDANAATIVDDNTQDNSE